jgi:hypothetical protein
MIPNPFEQPPYKPYLKRLLKRILASDAILDLNQSGKNASMASFKGGKGFCCDSKLLGYPFPWTGKPIILLIIHRPLGGDWGWGMRVRRNPSFFSARREKVSYSPR